MKEAKASRISEKINKLGLGCGFIHVNGFEVGVRVVEKAIEAGINYFDVAPTYPDAKANYGLNEKIVGRGIRGKEKEVFMATKILTRSASEAKREIEESIGRLGKIDLIQLHAVDTAEAMELVLAEDGALAAAIEAQKQGLVKYIGITNHFNPAVLEKCLAQFDFDSVLVPAGMVDHLKNRFQNLLNILQKTDKFLAGMKILGHGALGTVAGAAIKYGLQQPLSVVLVGAASERELGQALEAWRQPALAVGEKRQLAEFTKAAISTKSPWWFDAPSGAFPFGYFLKS